MNLALGDHVATGQKNYLIGNRVHFVQDVAGDDDVHAFFSERTE